MIKGLDQTSEHRLQNCTIKWRYCESGTPLTAQVLYSRSEVLCFHPFNVTFGTKGFLFFTILWTVTSFFIYSLIPKSSPSLSIPTSALHFVFFASTAFFALKKKGSIPKIWRVI